MNTNGLLFNNNGNIYFHYDQLFIMVNAFIKKATICQVKDNFILPISQAIHLNWQ